MSVGFTPGPWTPSVESKPFAAGGHWYVVLDTEENGIGEFYGDDHETNVANLRMAAAAPAMFDMLTIAARTIEIFNETLKDHGTEQSEQAADVVLCARAILAKARGDLVDPLEQVQA